MENKLNPIERLRILFKSLSKTLKSDRPSTPESQTDYPSWFDAPSQSQTDYPSWFDSSVTDVDDDPSSERDFLNPSNEEDVANILRDVIGTKDFYSQEEFTPGETVYLCRHHQLGFHEDSWRELESKCPECGNDHYTTPYILPEI